MDASPSDLHVGGQLYHLETRSRSFGMSHSYCDKRDDTTITAVYHKAKGGMVQPRR